MQFYRKWFYNDDLDIRTEKNIFTNALSTWGFVERDGSPLKQTYDGTWKGNDCLRMRWRYNNDLSTHFKVGSIWSVSPQGNNQRIWYLPQNEAVGDYPEKEIISYNTGGTWMPIQYFFIPLKNRGFLLYNDYYYDQFNPRSIGDPPILRPFRYIARTSGGTNEQCGPGGIMIYNNISNTFCFLHFSYYSAGADYATNEGNILLHYYIDYQCKARRNNIKYSVIGDTVSQTELTYDYKPNICSLIKYPYENGFLSNLFIITTSPSPMSISSGVYEPGVWGKFFSFGGRNFYCPFANLAVELPSN